MTRAIYAVVFLIVGILLGVFSERLMAARQGDTQIIRVESFSQEGRLVRTRIDATAWFIRDARTDACWLLLNGGSGPSSSMLAPAPTASCSFK
jgi:hypothetical protein